MVEGRHLLPVGVLFVSLRIQNWCSFRLVRPAEGLFKEPKEVHALGVQPGHGLHYGDLGGVVGDRGLVEDVDAGVGFRRRWLRGTGGCGGGPFAARALSGVQEVDVTLRWGCLAVPHLGLGQGPCVVDLVCVLGAGEVLYVWGA